MYAPMEIDGQEFYLKPMNCPFHIHDLQKPHALLPRPAPAVCRVGHGLSLRAQRRAARPVARARLHAGRCPYLLQARPDAGLRSTGSLHFCLHILRGFGFTEFNAYLSTRPEKRRRRGRQWDAAEQALRDALERGGIPYEVDEGGGVFYGPKIDLKMLDALRAASGR